MSAQDRPPTVAPGDPGLTGVDAALRRAAVRARREAAAAGGTVVVFRDGKIVLEEPGPEVGPAPGRDFPQSDPP